MRKFLKSLFGGGGGSSISRPLPPEHRPAVLRDVCSQRDRVDDYFRSSVLPSLAKPLSSMFDREVTLPTGRTNGLTAFFAHRALTLVSDLQYVAPQHGHDFADALCESLYGSESFRICPHLSAYLDARENHAVRECFARRLADSLGEQGTGAATFIHPFALMAACDLDFPCLARTAEAFGDTTNAQRILTQRDEFFAKSANA